MPVVCGGFKLEEHSDEVTIESRPNLLTRALIFCGASVLLIVLISCIHGRTDLSASDLAFFSVGAAMLCSGITIAGRRQILTLNSTEQTLVIDSEQMKELLHVDDIRNIQIKEAPEAFAHALFLETTDGRSLLLAAERRLTALNTIAATITQNLGLPPVTA